MGMNSYFVIVTRTDKPIFEAEFFRPDYLSKLDNDKTLHQFIIYAALDMFEATLKKTTAQYLSIIDRYGEWMVSAFVSTGGERFMLLHDAKNDDGIKQFFTECHDLFVKYTLNPFYAEEDSIESGPFEVKVRLLAKKYLEK